MGFFKRVSLLTFVLMLVVSITAFAAPVQVTILHTNDVHGHISPFTVSGVKGELGGFARLATLVNQVRNEQPNTMLLDAGDILHGTNVVTSTRGLNMVALMNGLGYDAMVPGNHDFNYGYQQLLSLGQLAKFAVVSANVVKDGDSVFAPYTIIEKGGYNFAIIGLSSPETPILTHPNNVIGLNFTDPVAKAKEMVAKVKDSADFIIVLSHLGYDVDQVLAKEVPGINVIIGGHSHTVLDKQVVINGVTIAQTGEWGKNLGRVDLTIDGKNITTVTSKLIPVTEAVAKNPAVNTVVKAYEDKLNEVLGVVVGKADADLIGDRGQVRTRETNLADIVADVMLNACDADIAVTNGGGIRASILKGDITVGSIYTVLPFDNTLVVIQVTGAQLKAALELSVTKYPAENGGFLQVAGLKFTFDPSKPAGQRVLDVTVKGQPLDLNKSYKVATNDFTAAGGDGYTMFKEGKVLFQSGLYLRDLMVSYVQAHGNVNAKTDGRITVK